MKVTVCFNNVRVVVPVGDGQLLVRDLILESVRRYKKAAAKNPDSWVVVHHLQSQSGILDPDDHVSDVADDREQILASYDDCPGPDPTVPQGGGDGASGSSVGTSSPDIFRNTTDGKYGQHNESVATHIDVTASDQPPNGLTLLQVRRGSEPSLLHCDLDQNSNQLYNNNQSSQEPSKRWSAAPVCRSDSEPPERLLTGSANSSYLSPKWSVPEEESHNDSLPSFSRSGRLSMQFLGDGAGYRWMEAADKAIQSQPTSYNSKSLPRDAKRKEPLGQANHEITKHKIDEMLLIVNENGGPLGLTAIPDQENGGLLVQSVEPGSRAERGRLRRADRILEINGIHLVGLSENSVQDHLRKCIGAAELRLRVIRADVKPTNEIYAADERQVGGKVNGQNVSPTRKMPGATGGSSLQAANTRKLGRRHDITLKKGSQGLGFSVTTRDNPAGGHCPIYIKNILPKGAAVEDGRLKPGDRLLEVDGHTMTGKSQTEVVNILRATQLGATVKIVVSRQNELVEIDERDIDYGTVTPKPPPPVLPAKSVLKSPSAPSIRDCIEKQPKENLFPKEDPANTSNVRMRIKKFSTSNGPETPNGATVFPWRNREVLTLHIPVHDTEKAGLGVSVKGKTGSSTPNSTLSHNTSFSSTKHHDGDLGIFVKSVLHGGAASRDGRLKMNDQLLSVNSVSLLGQSNAEAMDTLRRAMFHTGGKYPGIITLGVARRAGSRPNSTIEPTENGVEQEEQTGSTIVYLTPNEKTELSAIHGGSKRFSNPVLDRLTGGSGNNTSIRAAQAAQAAANGLRNDSYYMATNEMWSPAPHMNLNGSNAVLIEEDPSEPTSPALPLRNDPMQQISTSTPNGDITYASQLSLEHPNSEAFSRDAVGRRSMSEKHHAALDARETGTYQRNKKLRQEREQDKKGGKLNTSGGSMESLTNVQNRIGSMKNKRSELRAEALDRVGELGPSLGMKKSSSLESLQTMVQEIQMSDEPRGPNALRTPRGRGREEVLRAAVERGPDAQPRKHWLLEDGMTDQDGGFPNRGPFQSSLNDGKNKNRQKKQGGLLKGIGHMFRFGKHRKDVFPAPTEVISDYGGWSANDSTLKPGSPATLPANPSSQPRDQRETTSGPPMYQPPPAVGPLSNGIIPSNGSAVNSKINQNDAFNHRYSHYVNYDELQMQLRNKLIVSKMKQRAPQRPQSQIVTSKSAADLLSESLIERMREQVRVQRAKVEEESRRNQHYHSQRSARNVDMSHYQQYIGQPINGMNSHKYHQQLQQQQQRPNSSYYEYETINTGSYRKIADHAGAKWPPSQPSNGNKNGGNQLIVSGTSSVRTHRGPFVTQVHIRDQNGHQPSASKV